MIIPGNSRWSSVARILHSASAADVADGAPHAHRQPPVFFARCFAVHASPRPLPPTAAAPNPTSPSSSGSSRITQGNSRRSSASRLCVLLTTPSTRYLSLPLSPHALLERKWRGFLLLHPRGISDALPCLRDGYGVDDGYLEHYEEGLLIMCQVETEKGVREVEAIAEVEGVDCVEMGPLDLSACLGYLWEPGHRKVREVMAELERRVLSKSGGGGAYLSGFAMPHDPPEELKRRGYHMVAGAVDLGMFRKAAVEDVSRFRNAPGSRDAASSGEEGEEGDEKEKGYWTGPGWARSKLDAGRTRPGQG